MRDRGEYFKITVESLYSGRKYALTVQADSIRDALDCIGDGFTMHNNAITERAKEVPAP